MKNGVLSNFIRSHISSDRVRSGYEIILFFVPNGLHHFMYTALCITLFFRIRTLLSFSNPMTFHDLTFSCHFRKFSKSSFFSGIFRHNLPVNLQQFTYPIHYNFPRLSMTHQAWTLKYVNSMTFQVFHAPYEPWFFPFLR